MAAVHTASRSGMVAAYVVPYGAGEASPWCSGPHKSPAAHSPHPPVSAWHMGAATRRS